MADGITIRHSTEEDAPMLGALAQLDSRRAPEGDVLLAVVDGELRAAVGTDDGRVVADPFHLTDDVVRLLLLRAALERGERRTRRGFRRLREFWTRAISRRSMRLQT